jgi:hypothetical protein
VAAALRTRSSARRSPLRSTGNCASWPHHRRRPCGRTAVPVGVSSSARHRITSLVLLAGKKPDVPKFLPAYQKAAKIAAAAAVRLGVRKQPRRPAHRPAACAYLPLAASRGRCTLTVARTAQCRLEASPGLHSPTETPLAVLTSIERPAHDALSLRSGVASSVTATSIGRRRPTRPTMTRETSLRSRNRGEIEERLRETVGECRVVPSKLR